MSDDQLMLVIVVTLCAQAGFMAFTVFTTLWKGNAYIKGYKEGFDRANELADDGTKTGLIIGVEPWGMEVNVHDITPDMVGKGVSVRVLGP